MTAAATSPCSNTSGSPVRRSCTATSFSAARSAASSSRPDSSAARLNAAPSPRIVSGARDRGGLRTESVHAARERAQHGLGNEILDLVRGRRVGDPLGACGAEQLDERNGLPPLARANARASRPSASAKARRTTSFSTTTRAGRGRRCSPIPSRCQVAARRPRRTRPRRPGAIIGSRPMTAMPTTRRSPLVLLTSRCRSPQRHRRSRPRSSRSRRRWDPRSLTRPRF